MKKGFILALLVVAMVAVVLPVSARAPIIQSLPTIIIGDTDTTAPNTNFAGGKGIMRYIHALNLSQRALVDWNNDESYTSDTFHAYLYPADALPDTTINPFVDGSIINTLSPAEYADALSATAMPPANTEILSWTSPSVNNWFINVFDAGRHPSITDPFNADPTTQGETPAAAYTKEVAMKLVCGVTSGTVLAASAKDLTVQCVSTGLDHLEGTFTPVVNYSFTGTNEGWTWTTSAGYTPPVQTTAGSGTTGIGFIQATAIPTITGNCYYAGWLSPINISSTEADGGKVYRATASLESTSTSAETALGFRLRYFNKGFAHQGFVVYQT